MDIVEGKSIKIFIIIGVIIFITIIGGIGTCYYYNYLDTKEQEKILKEQEEQEKIKENIVLVAQKDVSNMFEEDVPKNDITDGDIDDAIKKIELVEDDEIKSSLYKEIKRINEYREVEVLIDELLVDNVLVSNYDNDKISLLQEKYSKLPAEWQVNVGDSVNKINTQKNNIVDAEKKVKVLFSDSKYTKLKTSNVTRKKYNSAKTAVDKLVQKDLKKKYNEALTIALTYLEEQEEKARQLALEKAKKEAEIKASWVILDTPYISQNKNKIYNGCEAASLLMALQYKGYLKGTSLKEFVDEMPKSDDPHMGFVRDIYGTDPRNVPHWIAPDALARYGRKAIGNNIVVDITGTSVDGLKKELDNGNPVVIYATGGNFADPINWVEEVPQNVHVMLLIGYNSKSKQMLIHDPWTRKTGKVYISESRFTTIYNKIGKKAVVVR